MSALRLIALAAACAAALGGNALAGGVLVPMDNVTLVAFKKPVSTVYIGNASIAQVTMLDSRHVFVLGKRFGVTNLIALRADRSVLSNETVLVSARTGGAVTIFRGADTFNYACSSFHCETRPVPGDQKTYYDNTEDSAIKHEDAGNKGTTIATQQH